MERNGEPVGWEGKTVECPEGRLELELGAGRQHLKLEIPSLPFHGRPSEEALRERFRISKQIVLVLARGRPHEEDVVLEVGGALQILHPPGVDFGSWVRRATGAKAPYRARVRYPDPTRRESYPIPAGAYEVVLTLHGAEQVVPVTIEEGRVTEIRLDPAAFRGD